MPDTTIVGILGGMGPAATAQFYELLVSRTPATVDQEHLRVVMWADPTVPDRVAAARGMGDPVEPALMHGLAILRQAGASLVACPCNTAHIWLPGLAEQQGLPLVNIVEETVQRCRNGQLATSSVAILATPATIEAGLYQQELQRQGLDPVVPAASTQDDVVTAIRLVKAGGENNIQRACHALGSALAQLRQEGVSGAIAGCTEVGLLVNRGDFPVRLVDSMTALADAVVSFCSKRAQQVPGQKRTP